MITRYPHDFTCMPHVLSPIFLYLTDLNSPCWTVKLHLFYTTSSHSPHRLFSGSGVFTFLGFFGPFSLLISLMFDFVWLSFLSCYPISPAAFFIGVFSFLNSVMYRFSCNLCFYLASYILNHWVSPLISFFFYIPRVFGAFLPAHTSRFCPIVICLGPT